VQTLVVLRVVDPTLCYKDQVGTVIRGYPRSTLFAMGAGFTPGLIQ